ncbi:MAG: hypothetical protein EXQ58_13130 [Acidobacteria bacterium]|nr:hypothetical protein [Acidobacteriota bacterium]
MKPRYSRKHDLSQVLSSFLATRLRYLASLLCATFACPTAYAEVITIRSALVEKAGVVGVEYRSGDSLVGRSTDAAPAGVELLLPGAPATPVQFRTKTKRGGVLQIGPVKIGTLTLRWRIVTAQVLFKSAK